MTSEGREARKTELRILGLMAVAVVVLVGSIAAEIVTRDPAWLWVMAVTSCVGSGGSVWAYLHLRKTRSTPE